MKLEWYERKVLEGSGVERCWDAMHDAIVVGTIELVNGSYWDDSESENEFWSLDEAMRAVESRLDMKWDDLERIEA